MLRAMWFYTRIAALKINISPTGLFLALHMVLWCNIAWVVCRGIYAAMGIPALLHSMDTLLAMAYSGIFIGIIGGAIYLIHENFV